MMSGLVCGQIETLGSCGIVRHCRQPRKAAASKQRDSRRTLYVAAEATADPYKVLGVSRRSSKTEIKEAYLKQIRRFHPDVSMEEDALAIATRLNIAYQTLVQGARGAPGGDWEPLDVFDSPEAEPDCLFVNPFACNILPLEWQKLQEVASGEGDPVSLLSQNGVSAPDSAIFYLSPMQLELLETELEEMSESMEFEFASYSIAEKLGRARIANNRMPVRQ